MSPENKIKYAILAIYFEQEEREIPKDLNDEQVADLYDDHSDELYDIIYEFREGQVETNVPSESSRHYESNSVAAQTPSGEWVGWTYWYGGGKHGDPESIDWVEHAYDLDCTEEEKLVTVRNFTKKDSK